MAEAGAGPRFPVLCLPTVAEHPGGRERERVVALLCTGFTGLLMRAKGSSDPSFELLQTRASAAVPPTFAEIYTGGYILQDAGQAEDLL